MKDDQNQNTEDMPQKPNALVRFFKTLGIIVFACVLTAVLTIAGLKMYLFPGEFKPVELTKKEQIILEEKLSYIQPSGAANNKIKDIKSKQSLTPMPYSEADAIREISFTERELNAMLAKNTDLATKLAIDLEKDLASVRLRLPLDPDMPFLGGETLKASAGVEMRYAESKPVVVLKGVMLWGVPIPNAWLGDLKNVDLVQEFEDDEGFWKTFADGIENISIEQEKITIKFKE